MGYQDPTYMAVDGDVHGHPHMITGVFFSLVIKISWWINP